MCSLVTQVAGFAWALPAAATAGAGHAARGSWRGLALAVIRDSSPTSFFPEAQPGQRITPSHRWCHDPSAEPQNLAGRQGFFFMGIIKLCRHSCFLAREKAAPNPPRLRKNVRPSEPPPWPYSSVSEHDQFASPVPRGPGDPGLLLWPFPDLRQV